MVKSLDFYEKLGKRIKEFRKLLNISQKDLAKKLEVPRTTISQIENGKRELHIDEIAKIAKIFNVTIEELIDPKKSPQVIIEKAKEEKQENKIRINVPQKNLKKFKEVLLYILNKVGSKPNIGETVIYKLLYFIDFDFYEKYEEQLIGATYIKNHYGPTPLEFQEIIREMINNKELIIVESEYFIYPQRKYLPLREPDLSVLKAHELELIDEVLNKLSNMNATEISEYSHNDVPWLVTENGKIIEYETVFYRTKPYSVRSYSDEIQGD